MCRLVIIASGLGQRKMGNWYVKKKKKIELRVWVLSLLLLWLLAVNFMQGIYNYIPKKAMSLRYIILQQFCGYNLWYV